MDNYTKATREILKEKRGALVMSDKVEEAVRTKPEDIFQEAHDISGLRETGEITGIRESTREEKEAQTAERETAEASLAEEERRKQARASEARQARQNIFQAGGTGGAPVMSVGARDTYYGN